MKPFQYENHTINFSSCTGTVLDSERSSEINIGSTGGGGYIKNGTGYISAPHIHSTTIRKHSIWLMLENGKEEDFRIGGADIPIRVGQKVTVVTGCPDGSDSGWNVLVHNHNASRYWYVLSDDQFVDYFRLAGKWGWQGFVLLLVFPAFVIGGFITFDLEGVLWGALFSIIAYIVLLIASNKSSQAKRAYIAALLKVHLGELAEEIARNGR